MRSLLLAVLAAYVISAIHAVLAFLNKRRSLQRVSEWAMAAGFALHTAALIADWAIYGHYPLFYLRETLSFLAWTLIASYGLVLYRYRARPLGTVTLPLVSVLIFVAVVTRSATPDLSEASTLSASWLFPVHTTLLFFAYAAFFVVFLASVMYLLQERELKLKTFSAFFHRLPSLTTVNEIATSSAAIGLTLLTVGMATGMVWSSSRDGRLWHNDPKEIFAALTWLLYLALILYRSTSSWRGRKAAWMGVAGFALVLLTFLGARLMGGYHDFG
ncbi:MAG TPA: cytochrome c biogenesis protein CcsA [Pyrinomonadaceae bacterium]|jgi:ABC-type transport system involved in cytochrome c biogenesis permease subunit|nr:cytochrome c biogenesis protein CcsA [Pyrinomonadaceae bacterium]